MKSSSLAILAAMHSCILPAETLDIGKGSYTTTITGNFTAPPAKIYRTTNVRGPVPTNDWGGKATYETWFSNAPHCKTGINLLPIHGGSLYLGRYPAFVQANHDQTLAASNGKWQGWPSIMISYRALTDAQFAHDDWKSLGKNPNLDSGNFPANAVHWVENLRQLGQLNRTVTCNHPLSATFQSRSGKTSHVVCLSGNKPVKVIFSDGTRFQAQPGKFTVK